MARQKREAVYATFHYLVRHTPDGNGGNVTSGFTQAEFDSLVNKLSNISKVDLDDEATLDRVRFRNLVPIENVKPVDGKTAFGLYRAAYWGHSYQNTAVGTIPADSVSLRPFYFALYLSKSGRLYIGVQYLAQFGSYDGLKKTILSLIDNSKNVVAHSFRRDSVGIGEIVATEVKVNISRRAAGLDEKGAFGQKAVVTFSSIRRDVAMQRQVNDKLIPFLGTEKEKTQKAVAQLLRDSSLTDVADDEIEGCTVIAEMNGKGKSIQFIGTGAYPSQYPLEVGFNADGHPTLASTRDSMLKVLEENILVVKEND
ncbi:hypothetical protein [Novosphingobium sp.]|uniref:hypothetical protein n=1 Tax=Novosphingobium sp. TaxID=1874826 RepID=UPI0038B85061